MIERAFVVDGSSERVIGIVKRTDVSSTYLRHVQGNSNQSPEREAAVESGGTVVELSDVATSNTTS